jgi:ketosteroid isomerase-like protein
MDKKEVAREFFVRFSSGDISGAIDLLSDDATWWLPGKPGEKPTAGPHTKEEIAELFRRMMDQLEEGLRIDIKNTLAERDMIAVEAESRGILTNGRYYNNEYLFLMRVTSERIVEVREYNDTQHAYNVWFAR